jgi:hypothetical protein
MQSGHDSLPSCVVNTSASHRYWAVARQRFERWQARLSLHRSRTESAGASRRVALWREIRPTIEEIFLSDVLTRMVAAFGTKLEAEGLDSDMGPIVYNIYSAQEDIRHRCLRLLVAPGLPVDQAVELNRIRHSLEHWTDAFLAYLSDRPIVLRFAFKPERTQEFVDEISAQPSEQARQVAWQLLTASCQKWMAKNCSSTSANPQLNQQLGEATLAMLQPDRFPSLSPFPSLASDRMTTLIDQADLWLAKLLYAESV